MLDTSSLLNSLTAYANKTIYVALSGGVDSMVLLTLLSKTHLSVKAIHVNHGISENSDEWQQHCQNVCDELSIEFIAEKVDVVNKGKGIESAARDVRYAMFKKHAQNHVLLTAHHQDDQIETFLLRLLRGAGVDGLSAMSSHSEREGYQLIRPLLNVPKADLIEIAQSFGLSWVNDESNDSDDYDRNFLRNQCLPLMSERWPNYRKNMARTVAHMQQASGVLKQHIEGQVQERLTDQGAFNLVDIEILSDSQRQSLLRHWLVYCQLTPIHPSSAQLQQLSLQSIAVQDASPVVQVGCVHIRRFKGLLFVVPILADIEALPARLEAEQSYYIKGMGTLSFEKKMMTDKKQHLLRSNCFPLTLKLRQGGERVQPYLREKSRDLKRLFQDYQVPTWWRDRLPILYAEGTGDIVAVADLFVERSAICEINTFGYSVVWQRDQG